MILLELTVIQSNVPAIVIKFAEFIFDRKKINGLIFFID
jgi:hypothetical protein